jgi:formate hydrogenlyase subunit 5
VNGARCLDLTPGELAAACRRLLDAGGRMQMAYAWFPDRDGEPELRYLASEQARQPFVVWRVRAAGEQVPSLATIAPLLGWHEREMMDLTGVRIADHPQPYRLVLHEGAKIDAPPLDPRHPSRSLLEVEAEDLGIMPQVEGEHVQLLPFGPIRADVLESAQFLFQYVGEGILHYHPRLFFKHRGMELRFEGLEPDLGVVLAERVSGVDSVAHALAFAQAVEAAARCEVPRRARWLRVIAAELERVYNHLHYLGHLCHTTTLKVGEAQGKLLEERAKQINARVSGSRFLRGVVAAGGVRRELEVAGLADALASLRDELRRYVDLLLRSDSHLDRLITTGSLDRDHAFDLGATGPVERASGLDRDLRRDHPYAAYDELETNVALRVAGDANARMQVRIDELDASFELLQRAISLCPTGPLRAPLEPRPGSEGLGWAEASRGTLFYAVHLRADGAIARAKIESPSFSNWRVFPYTVHDTNMMDYAINEASFGLTIAGCDR